MDGGIGEAALISAAIGGGGGALGSALGGGNTSDILSGGMKGALLGGLTGGATAGLGAAMGGASGVGAGALNSAATMDTVGSDALGFLPAGGGAPAASNIMADTGGMPFDSGSQNIVDNMKPTVLSGSNAQSIAGQSLSPTSSASNGLLDFGYKGTSPNIFGYGPQSNLALGALGAGTALSTAMQQERDRYAPPGITPYTGILSKYNPYSARGVEYPTHMAEGGITSLAMGGQPNQMYPMSQQEHTVFATPNQMPTSAMAVRDFEPATNPMTGEPSKPMAEGGITSLGHFSDGGQLLKGPGDGMSDDIPAKIGNHQPARLADGEFVIPADVVSHLGNGSTDAGAKHLYAMMHKVRKARTGNPKQGKQINPHKFLPA